MEPRLDRPLPFEILAANEFTGNLDKIDEHPSSYARVVEGQVPFIDVMFCGCPKLL